MILVFGSVNADLFLNVARLPARGETVLCPTNVFRPGGKGANQAAAAARASRPGGSARSDATPMPARCWRPCATAASIST